MKRITIPDDIYAVVRSLAGLLRKGLRPEPGHAQELFPVFPVPGGAAPITLEQTLSAGDDV